MAYDKWTIGGLTPSWIEKITPAPTTATREFKVDCIAHRDRLDGEDPRSEIELFEAMVCDVTTNTQLMNGGSCLQICNGDYIEVSDGITTWLGAVKSVEYVPDYRSKIEMNYTITIVIETVGSGINYIAFNNDISGGDGGGSIIAIEDLGNINFIWFMWPYESDNLIGKVLWNPYTDGAEGSTTVGMGFGEINITAPKNVKAVKLDVYARTLPAWIEVNGKRQNLSVGLVDGVYRGSEILTFVLATPSKDINIISNTHLSTDTNSIGLNKLGLNYA